MTRLARRLVFAQAADVATFCAFFLLIPVSPHTERNPLIAAMFWLGGFALVGVVKIAAAVWIGWKASQPMRQSRIGPVRAFALAHPNFYPRLAVVMISVATASGIAGAGFNLASLLDSLRLVG